MAKSKNTISKRRKINGKYFQLDSPMKGVTKTEAQRRQKALKARKWKHVRIIKAGKVYRVYKRKTA